jgi:predicted XRE-type DNA-binding protein
MCAEGDFRMTPFKQKHLGSEFDAFLEEERLLDQAEAVATKRVLAWEIAQAMKEQGLSKVEMARAMRTSRSALDRLLDPQVASVTLLTIERAARALGRKLSIELR